MVYNENFFVLHMILMKLGEVVGPMCTTTKFDQNWMKNKNVLIIDHLTEVSSVKVLLRSY